MSQVLKPGYQDPKDGNTEPSAIGWLIGSGLVSQHPVSSESVWCSSDESNVGWWMLLIDVHLFQLCSQVLRNNVDVLVLLLTPQTQQNGSNPFPPQARLVVVKTRLLVGGRLPGSLSSISVR